MGSVQIARRLAVLLMVHGAALSLSEPSNTPRGHMQHAGATLLPGTAVGPYLLQERLRSLPSTFAPSIDLVEQASTDLVAEIDPADWSQLFLPLTNFSEPGPTQMALPSPELQTTPKLPQSFETELLSGSKTAYRLHRRVQRGAHGEVWRAVRRDDASAVPLILKRLHQSSSTLDGIPSAALLAGLRERHFGETLRGLPRLARFVECFEESGSFWLVFRDEGLSLRDLFYSTKQPDGEAAGAEQMVMVQPSSLWLRMRLDVSGRRVLRHMLVQFFEGLASLHARNVTHRDLKPANTIVDLRGGGHRVGGAAKQPSTL